MKVLAIFVLYLIACAAQLYACMPPMKLRLRYATKLMLMPLLALWLLFRTDPVPVPVFLGLIAGFFGDMLLLAARKKSILFVAGSCFFGAGHILYTVWFTKNALPLNGLLPVLIPAALVYAVPVFLHLRGLSKHAGKVMTCCMAAYFIVIAMMSLSALAFALRNGGTAWLAWGASVLFLISDGILTYDKYVEKLRFRNLLVMSTYILAQTGIAVAAMFFMKG